MKTQSRVGLFSIGFNTPTLASSFRRKPVEGSSRIQNLMSLRGDMTNTSLLPARIIYFIFNFFCALATLHETNFPDFSEVSIHVFHPPRVSWLSFNGFQFHICAGIAVMLPTSAAGAFASSTRSRSEHRSRRRCGPSKYIDRLGRR